MIDLTNEQKIFNKVARHLLKQRSRAEKDNSCRLRTEDGRTCAIGCLIPKSKYSEDMENYCYPFLVLEAIYGSTSIKVRILLESLQYIHDHKPVSKWYDSLKKLAKESGLKFGHDLTKLQ